MMATATLLEDVNLLVQEGVYENRESLVQDALRALLRSKPELRNRLALSLYKQQNVSFARAAEIAGVDQESLKELLREAGISYQMTSVDNREFTSEVEQLMRLRAQKK